MTAPSSKRNQLLQALRHPEGGWELNPDTPRLGSGASARFRREVPTPPWTRDKRSHRLGPVWGDRFYVQMVSVTLIRAGAARPLIRVITAPWAEARTYETTLAKALEIIVRPADVLPIADWSQAAMMFEAGYADRSDVTVGWLHAHGRRVDVCDCGDETCEGFQMAHTEDDDSQGGDH